MKKILIGIILLLFISPINLYGEEENNKYWFCNQIGYIEKEKTIIISNIFSDYKENNYEKRETAFEEVVKKEISNKFIEHLSSECTNYSNKKKAEKYLKRLLNKAKKHNFQIIHIKFSY